MSDLSVRLAILVGVSVVAFLIVFLGKRFVEHRRQLVLSATPAIPVISATPVARESPTESEPLRILVFSSDDCRQCHQFQTPALKRVLEARGNLVSVIEVDAPTSPELTERYQVLTVPTTVLLDASGKACAVNYGFTNTQRLLEQIDNVVAQSSLI